MNEKDEKIEKLERKIKYDESKVRENIGSKLKKWRKENNLAQKTIEELLGINQSKISELEAGKQTPSLDKAIKISKLTETSLDELCGLEKQNELLDLAKILCKYIKESKIQYKIRPIEFYRNSKDNPTEVVLNDDCAKEVEITFKVTDFTGSLMNQFLLHFIEARKNLKIRGDEMAYNEEMSQIEYLKERIETYKEILS